MIGLIGLIALIALIARFKSLSSRHFTIFLMYSSFWEDPLRQYVFKYQLAN